MVRLVFAGLAVCMTAACTAGGSIALQDGTTALSIGVASGTGEPNNSDELLSISSSGVPPLAGVSNRVVTLDQGGLARVGRNSPQAPFRPPPGADIAYLVDAENEALIAVNVEALGASGNGLDDTAFGAWMADFATLEDSYSAQRIGAFLFGRSTRSRDMPTFGEARYEGYMTAIELAAGGTATLLDGPGRIFADFDRRRIDGRFDLTSESGFWGRLDIDETAIDDNGFRGQTVSTSRGYSGLVSGVFSGPNADEVGGVVELGDNQGGQLQGAFGARLD